MGFITSFNVLYWALIIMATAVTLYCTFGLFRPMMLLRTTTQDKFKEMKTRLEEKACEDVCENNKSE